MLLQKSSASGRKTGFRLALALSGFGVAAALYCPTAVNAQSPAPQSYGLFNTGIDTTAMLNGDVVDNAYTVSLEGASTPIASTLYVTDLTGLPYSPANDSTSTFISPQPSYAAGQVDAGGEYDFTTTFDLTGVNLSTLTLSGSFESDDRIDNVLLNGNSLGIFLPDPDYHGFSGYFNLAANPSFLNQGTNTLTFQVFNFTTGTNKDPVALRTVFIDAVPEPSTWMAIGSLVALAGFGHWMRRRAVAV